MTQESQFTAFTQQSRDAIAALEEKVCFIDHIFFSYCLCFYKKENKFFFFSCITFVLFLDNSIQDIRYKI